MTLPTSRVVFPFAAKNAEWQSLCLDVPRDATVRVLRRDRDPVDGWCVAEREDGVIGLVPSVLLSTAPPTRGVGGLCVWSAGASGRDHHGAASDGAAHGEAQPSSSSPVNERVIAGLRCRMVKGGGVTERKSGHHSASVAAEARSSNDYEKPDEGEEEEEEVVARSRRRRMVSPQMDGDTAEDSTVLPSAQREPPLPALSLYNVPSSLGRTKAQREEVIRLTEELASLEWQCEWLQFVTARVRAELPSTTTTTTAAQNDNADAAAAAADREAVTEPPCPPSDAVPLSDQTDHTDEQQQQQRNATQLDTLRWACDEARRLLREREQLTAPDSDCPVQDRVLTGVELPPTWPVNAITECLWAEYDTLASYNRQHAQLRSRLAKRRDLLAQLEAESTALRTSEEALKRISEAPPDDGFPWPRELDGATGEEAAALGTYVCLFDKYTAKRAKIAAESETETSALSARVQQLRDARDAGDAETARLEQELSQLQQFLSTYGPAAEAIERQLTIGQRVLAQKEVQLRQYAH